MYPRFRLFFLYFCSSIVVFVFFLLFDISKEEKSKTEIKSIVLILLKSHVNFCVCFLSSPNVTPAPTPSPPSLGSFFYFQNRIQNTTKAHSELDQETRVFIFQFHFDTRDWNKLTNTKKKTLTKKFCARCARWQKDIFIRRPFSLFFSTRF